MSSDDLPTGASPAAILGIPGSLRRASVNAAALRAAATAAEARGVRLTATDLVRELPLFDPDLEETPAAAVVAFLGLVERADAVLLAVPEYAHGIPGAFKNALDWSVRRGSLAGKPVTMLSVSPPWRGERMRTALTHVLDALDADVAHASVPILPADRDSLGEVVTPGIVKSLGDVVHELARRATGP